jgi:hypothetical protein
MTSADGSCLKEEILVVKNEYCVLKEDIKSDEYECGWSCVRTHRTGRAPRARHDGMRMRVARVLFAGITLTHTRVLYMSTAVVRRSAGLVRFR